LGGKFPDCDVSRAHHEYGVAEAKLSPTSRSGIVECSRASMCTAPSISEGGTPLDSKEVPPQVVEAEPFVRTDSKICGSDQLRSDGCDSSVTHSRVFRESAHKEEGSVQKFALSQLRFLIGISGHILICGLALHWGVDYNTAVSIFLFC
jgi:hypothetical protein